MESQGIIKPVIRLGNSAGVILPREWLNGQARVVLVKAPSNINKEVFEILDSVLESVLGIYLVGSYARGEEKEDSDIDVLVITSDINSKIKKGKYDIILISKKNLESELDNNILPLLPMLKEAKPITNKDLIREYQSTSLSHKNLKWHFETTKTALNVIKEAVELAKERKEKISANIVYSLILRLRQVLIVSSLIANRKATNEELKRIIKKLTGSLESYKAYKLAKEKINNNKILNTESAENILSFIKEKIEEQKKWIKRR